MISVYKMKLFDLKEKRRLIKHMTDKAKGNLLFIIGISLLVLALVIPNYQMLFGTVGGILAIVSLYFETKVRIRSIISFFRGM